MGFKSYLFVFLIFLSCVVSGETTKTIFNPFTGKLDYITVLSSTTLPSGSTFYIRDDGVGGLFEVNPTSPTVITNGEFSFSNVSSPVAWIWVAGHRYRFTSVLDDIPAASSRGCTTGMSLGILLSITCP